MNDMERLLDEALIVMLQKAERNRRKAEKAVSGRWILFHTEIADKADKWVDEALTILGKDRASLGDGVRTNE